MLNDHKRVSAKVNEYHHDLIKDLVLLVVDSSVVDYAIDNRVIITQGGGS